MSGQSKVDELVEDFRRAVELASPRGDDRPERIMAEVHAIIKAVSDRQKERDAEICEGNNLTTGSIGPLMNVGWGMCQTSCANAIRTQEDK